MLFRMAANFPISVQTNTLPQMTEALGNWFQPMLFTKIIKRVVNFQVVEFEESIKFRGMMQPLKSQDLALKPEGQRAWKWLELHADTALILQPDDIVKYQGIKTRVMAKKNFNNYGYVYYELVQDWETCPCPE